MGDENAGYQRFRRVVAACAATAALLSFAPSVIAVADAAGVITSGGGGAAGTMFFVPRNAIVLDLEPNNVAVQENASTVYVPPPPAPVQEDASAAYQHANGTAVVHLRKLLATRRFIKQQERDREGLSCGLNTNSDDWDMDDDFNTPDDDTDDKRAGDPLHHSSHRAPSATHDAAVQAMLANASLRRVLEKVASENSWSVEYSEVIALEYMRALYTLKDAGPPMVPSHDVDLLWHGHILDTKQYASFCANFFGHFLHHAPSYTDSQKAALRLKYAVYLDHYAERFGLPNPSVWPSLAASDESCGDGTCGPPDYCDWTCNDNMN